ncbi:MAG: hypothetical protein KF799_08965 [Bdellovibrionales bacterium]|nr:hypothetical protein [Bdellovibrionales bacterium]
MRLSVLFCFLALCTLAQAQPKKPCEQELLLESIQVSPDVSRVPLSAVRSNPYSLLLPPPAPAAQVVERHHVDYLIIADMDVLLEGGAQTFAERRLGLKDSVVRRNWIKQVDAALKYRRPNQSSYIGLAKLWLEGERLNDIATRTFIGFFDTRLERQDLKLPGWAKLRRLAVISVRPRSTEVSYPSVSPFRPPPQQKVKTAAVEVKVSSHPDLLYQYMTKKRQLVVVSQEAASSEEIGPLSGKTMKRFVTDAIEADEIPPDNKPIRLVRCSFGRGHGSTRYFEFFIRHFVDEKGVHQFVIEGVSELSRPEVHKEQARFVMEDMSRGEILYGIWVPARLFATDFNVFIGVVKNALMYLEWNEEAQKELRSMAVGETRFLAPALFAENGVDSSDLFERRSPVFQFLRTESGWTLISFF